MFYMVNSMDNFRKTQGRSPAKAPQSESTFDSFDLPIDTPAPRSKPMRLASVPSVITIDLRQTSVDMAQIALCLRADPALWFPIEQSITEALVDTQHLDVETMGFRDSAPHAIDVTLTVRFYVEH